VIEGGFMNSYSNCYVDYEPCKKENVVVCNPTFIKCGTPGSVTIPADADVGDTFTLAFLTINTKCFCNPCTQLEVTSNIVPGTGADADGALSFQVTKQCSNQFTAVPVGPSFTYSVGTNAQTFSFFICDCDTCDHDCCTYRLVVTVNAAQDVEDNAPIVINNATIGSIITDYVHG
jgi:hypothetical protein